MSKVVAGVLAAAAAAACGPRMAGDGVRRDIAARMAAARDPIAACYQAALERNRGLRGTMIVTFSTRPGTGEFQDVRVARDDLHDPELERCVVAQVARLRLAAPTDSPVPVEYPIVFETQ
jgi:hypothetical protein